MPLPELCFVCHELKAAELGKWEKIPGRFRDRRWRCDACASKVSRRWDRGRDRQPSYLEKLAMAPLLESGYTFTREYPIGKFWFDFAIQGLRLLLEVDGRRWHHHLSRQARDRAKAAAAAKLGWLVIRVQLPDIEGKVAAALTRRECELAVTSPVVRTTIS